MKKIAIHNSKGGVAKTTTAIYFASELDSHEKTLLWDTNHQDRQPCGRSKPRKQETPRDSTLRAHHNV
ncbi:ParA family protein [Dermabacteraceae bacterium P13138]